MKKPDTNSKFDRLCKLLKDALYVGDKYEPRKWKSNIALRKEIIDADLSPHETLDEKIWALCANQPARPICVVCGGKVKLKCRMTGYRETCSLKCGANNEKTKLKTSITLQEKYGGHHTQNDKWIAQFVKDCHDAGSYEKGMKTFEKNHGVKNRFQLTSVKKTIKETNLARYGVENPMQSLEIADRTKQTTIERYGRAFNPTKTKETNLARYGVENPMQSDEIKARCVATCQDKYGVNHHMHDLQIKRKVAAKQRKQKIHVLPSGKTCVVQGYEPQVIDFVLKNGIYTETDISFNVPAVQWNNNGKISVYHADLYVPDENLLIEVKSTYTWFNDKHHARALAKAHAARSAGFNIEVWIWETNKKLPRIITFVDSENTVISW